MSSFFLLLFLLSSFFIVLTCAGHDNDGAPQGDDDLLQALKLIATNPDLFLKYPGAMEDVRTFVKAVQRALWVGQVVDKAIRHYEDELKK